jgi:beta-carotene 15,15'-dioxygenase
MSNTRIHQPIHLTRNVSILNHAGVLRESIPLNYYLLLAGIILLILSFWFLPDEPVQQSIFFISIILSGIPHGSLDYYVEKETLKARKQNITLAGFLAGYLLKMAAYALVWLAAPTLALLIFIGLTAYHFGEIDWPVQKRSRSESTLYTLYGLQLIIFIIVKNITIASPILELLVRHQVTSEQWIFWGTTALPYCMGSITASALVLIIFHRKIGWTKSMLLQFITQTAILCSILYALPLYMSFSFYFGCWHSLLSFNLVRKQLSLSNDSNGWFTLGRLALPFTAIAWLGIILLVGIQLNSTWLALSNLFISIAVLTLPHNLVFTRIRVINLPD